MANFSGKTNLHGCLQEDIQWMKVSQSPVTSKQANKVKRMLKRNLLLAQN